METSAKTDLNVNDLFLAIGAAQSHVEQTFVNHMCMHVHVQILRAPL